MLYFTIYKTTNIKNDKFYIGMHKTDNLEDEYLGSGTILKRSIRYHGKENFKRKILYLLDSEEEMIQKEIEIVNEKLLKDPLCMNIGIGGIGGLKNEKHAYNFHAAGGKKVFQLLGKKHIEKLKTDKEYKEKYSEITSKAQTGEKNGFFGKKHSKETKLKMSLSKKGRYKGTNHPQYGTCWITNEKESKKIFKGDNIPKGWRLGRKIKKSSLTYCNNV